MCGVRYLMNKAGWIGEVGGVWWVMPVHQRSLPQDSEGKYIPRKAGFMISGG